MSSLGGQHLPGDVSDQLGRAFTQIGEAQTLDCNGDELVSAADPCEYTN